MMHDLGAAVVGREIPDQHIFRGYYAAEWHQRVSFPTAVMDKDPEQR